MVHQAGAEAGGAQMFKQYAEDAQAHGRAVHVSHQKEDEKAVLEGNNQTHAGHTMYISTWGQAQAHSQE